MQSALISIDLLYRILREIESRPLLILKSLCSKYPLYDVGESIEESKMFEVEPIWLSFVDFLNEQYYFVGNYDD